MRHLTDAWRRLAMLLRRSELDNGLDEEFQFHIDRQIEKNLRAGMTPAEFVGLSCRVW